MKKMMIFMLSACFTLSSCAAAKKEAPSKDQPREQNECDCGCAANCQAENCAPGSDCKCM
jgi:hypothetical protein